MSDQFNGGDVSGDDAGGVLAALLTTASGAINLNAVWLAPGACLMQSHQPEPVGEVQVITVVGVADFQNYAGSVLMLD